jgi:hypothetical protein
MLAKNLKSPLHALVGTGSWKVNVLLEPTAGKGTLNPVGVPVVDNGGIETFVKVQTPAAFLTGPSKVKLSNP